MTTLPVQGRYLEALALRATRLTGNITNLKEEKPKSEIKVSLLGQQLMGTQVLWEASRTFGQQPEMNQGLLECDLCVREKFASVFRTASRQGFTLHQKKAHSAISMLPSNKMLKFIVPEEKDCTKENVHSKSTMETSEPPSKKSRLDVLDEMLSDNAVKCKESKRKERVEFSREEDAVMINTVLDRERLEAEGWTVYGSPVWKEMEKGEKVVKGRHRKTMMDRFCSVILGRLDNFELDPEQLRLAKSLKEYQEHPWVKMNQSNSRVFPQPNSNVLPPLSQNLWF